MSGREQFRLQIVGADEDVPRLLLVYGRGCGGEVAFVLRPREGEGVLVHQVKGQPAQVWVSNLGQLPEGIRPGNAGKLTTDGPQRPAWAVGASEAVALVKRLKARPPGAGPATLRGTWKGTLSCNDLRPTVHLERKVASYGVLHLDSDAEGRWTALFARGEKWFSTAKQDRSPPYDSLGEAIQRGMVQMTGLVSEACSFRDTRRRNTVDPSYAEAHPYRPPREVADPTEKYNPRAKYSVSEGAAGWNVLNDAGAVVAAFGAREKGKAREYASALNRGESPPAPVPTPQPEPRTRTPKDQASSEEVTAHAIVTASGGLEIKSGKHKGVIFKPYERAAVAGKVGQRVKVRFHPSDQFAHVVSTDEPPAQTAAEIPLLKDVSSPEPPSCPTSVAKIASATAKEADALEDLSGSLWGTTEGPELLRRAAKLIRHAESLVRSPLCKGAEQKSAWEQLKGAAEAYSKARDAVIAGHPKEAVKALKHISEKVSLAAARAAKACGQGGASGGGGGGKARGKADPAPAPAPEPESSGKKGGRKPKTDDKAQADKDAILMNAFSNAITAAVQQMQAGGAP